MFKMKVLRKTFSAPTIDALVAEFVAWRDQSNVGASKIGAMWPVTKDGVHVNDVSYNGRVWAVGERAAWEAKRAAAVTPKVKSKMKSIRASTMKQKVVFMKGLQHGGASMRGRTDQQRINRATRLVKLQSGRAEFTS